MSLGFSKHLREPIRRGEITCTIRIWHKPRVKIGGRYQVEGGHVVVTEIKEIFLTSITKALARRSGFKDVEDLLKTAQHGSGDRVFLVEFAYEPAPPEL